MTKPIKPKPKAQPTPTPTGPTFEQGVIVGTLMARGSFTGDKHTGRLAMPSGDLEMLQWVKSRIGGTISGPYSQKGRVAHYVYQISGQTLQPVIELLSAWMPTGAQRTKYLAWLKKYPNIVRPESSKVVS